MSTSFRVEELSSQLHKSHSTPYAPLMASSFVRKLYYLVSATEHKQIIGWVRDGSAFEVRNPKLMGKFELVASRIKFYAIIFLIKYILL